MSDVAIRIGSDTGRVYVKSPYNKLFVSRAKGLNGKWVSSTGEWSFDGRDEQRVRDLCTELYGTDGRTQALLVTLRVTLGSIDGRDITLGGRSLVRRRERDYNVNLGDGVIVLAGGFLGSGGSVKNPRVAPRAGTILEVRDFPEAKARELGPDGGQGRAGFNVEIVGEPYLPATSQAPATQPAAQVDPLTQAIESGISRINSEGAAVTTAQAIRESFTAWLREKGWTKEEFLNAIGE